MARRQRRANAAAGAGPAHAALLAGGGWQGVRSVTLWSFLPHRRPARDEYVWVTWLQALGLRALRCSPSESAEASGPEDADIVIAAPQCSACARFIARRLRAPRRRVSPASDVHDRDSGAGWKPSGAKPQQW